MTPVGSLLATILLVEDDSALATMLRDRLKAKGYCVFWTETAAEAELMANELRPDLFILDIMLPDMHGLVLCANLRERSPAPIIICSATKRKDDAVLGFKLGALDFLAKPFSGDELEARVETALRRPLLSTVECTSDDVVRQIGPLAIDQSRCRVALGGNAVNLTPIEYRLLCILAGRPNTVLSCEDLAERVWGSYDPGIRRSLEVHLRRLRAKLKAGPVPSPTLLAVRGFGYQLAWGS